MEVGVGSPCVGGRGRRGAGRDTCTKKSERRQAVGCMRKKRVTFVRAYYIQLILVYDYFHVDHAHINSK